MTAPSSSRAAMLLSLHRIIPPFPAARKGAHGKVLVCGGSDIFVGAPFYAAMSSLRTGADLCWLATHPLAAPSLKAHPELMVLSCPSLSDESPNDDGGQLLLSQLAATLGRIDALVVGPGLGRTPRAHDAMAALCGWARAQSCPVVVDADALWHAAEAPDLVRGARSFVLTPNGGELARLLDATGGGGADALAASSNAVATAAAAALLARRLGCAVLAKGAIDAIVAGGVTASCDEPGSPRRCGGQGDVLAGVLGCFLAWARIGGGGGHTPLPDDAVSAACWGAAAVTRAAAARAWAAQGRGMLTPDVLSALPRAFAELFPAI